jgi:hypothetical protein
MLINPLFPSTELECQRFEERQKVADARKAARKAGSHIRSDGVYPELESISESFSQSGL